MTQKSLPISGQGFQWLLCTPRIELPQTRDVEIKARPAQPRVLQGHLVYPLPPRGLEERPPAATMGFNWALQGGFKWPLRQKEQMKLRGGQKTL